MLFRSQPLCAQVGLGLSPMRTELRIAPGATYTGTLRLANEGGLVRVRTSLLDFRVDEDQTPQFDDHFASEAAFSCRDWLTVNPMETELKSMSDMPVRYTLRVPATVAPASYYCAVGFTSMPAAEEINGFGIRSAVRVVGALYVIVGTPQSNGALRGISIEHVPGTKDLRAVAVLENSSRMFYRPKGSLEVLSPDGQAIEAYEITPVPVLPQRKQRLVFPLKKLADGQPGTIRVRVDVGVGEIQEGTATVQGAANGQ